MESEYYKKTTQEHLERMRLENEKQPKGEELEKTKEKLRRMGDAVKQHRKAAANRKANEKAAFHNRVKARQRRGKSK